jgi:Ca2+-binding EF-hand superfamily protein
LWANLTHFSLERMLSDGDEDGDGGIDFDEFVTLTAHTLHR